VPGCTIREWGEGVITELFEFFRCEFLAFGAFAVASERSFLSVCLAATVSKPSELLPRPAGAEEKSDLRGREDLLSEVPDGCAKRPSFQVHSLGFLSRPPVARMA